jgi:predicted amidohydrolase
VEHGANCLFVTDTLGPKATYAKRHLFSFGGETASYRPGGENRIVEIAGMRFGLAICYDLRFAYHFWEQALSCDGYIIIANWPGGRREHWISLLRARAIENQAYVVGVNRVGADPSLTYTGDSSVYGPFGECLLTCESQEGLATVEVRASDVAGVREKFRFLRDRIQ